MKILAIDTSSGTESIALLEDGSTVGEWLSTRVGLHSRYLVGNIKRFLESLRVELSEIELFAVTTGPGSFTGLRVGISTVKGLSWTLGRAVAGVSTLESLAMNVSPTEATICPLMDARQKELYTALFRYRGRELERLTEDRCVKIESFIEFLEESGREDVILLGDGIEAAEKVIDVGQRRWITLPERFWHVGAHNVGILAWQKGIRESPHRLVPNYIRKSHAEIKKEGGSR